MTNKPEDPYTQILVKIENINTTITEVLKPAVDQVWNNKDEILIIKTNKKSSKDHRGRIVAYASLIISFIMVTLLGFRHFKG